MSRRRLARQGGDDRRKRAGAWIDAVGLHLVEAWPGRQLGAVDGVERIAGFSGLRATLRRAQCLQIDRNRRCVDFLPGKFITIGAEHLLDAVFKPFGADIETGERCGGRNAVSAVRATGAMPGAAAMRAGAGGEPRMVASTAPRPVPIRAPTPRPVQAAVVRPADFCRIT